MEYILVEDVSPKRLPGRLAPFGFGHACVRYTLPDGTPRLINITHKSGRLIEQYDNPADYLLGVDGKGGMHSRPICTIRIEDYPPELVQLLDNYYQVSRVGTYISCVQVDSPQLCKHSTYDLRHCRPLYVHRMPCAIYCTQACVAFLPLIGKCPQTICQANRIGTAGFNISSGRFQDIFSRLNPVTAILRKSSASKHY